MATNLRSVAAAPPLTGPIAAPRALRSTFYIALSAWMGVIVAIGFWPTYFGPLWQGVSEAPKLIHVHAAVFVGWVMLFAVQSYLAASRRVHVHRQFGRFVAVYALVIVGLGLATGFSQSAAYAAAGDLARSQTLLLAIVRDMVVFAGFFTAAIAMRRKPEVHKRLIVVACTAMLIAPAARAARAYDLSPTIFFLLWLAPIYVGALVDLVKSRRTHAIYPLSLGILFASAWVSRPGPISLALQNFFFA